MASGGGLAFGAILFAIGSIRNRSMRYWTATTGKVVNPGGRTSGVPALYPTFRWFDQHGVEHQRTSSMRAGFGPRPGTLVPIRYDPECPSSAMIDSTAQNGRILLYVGVAIMIVGALAAPSSWFLVNTLSN